MSQEESKASKWAEFFNGELTEQNLKRIKRRVVLDREAHKEESPEQREEHRQRRETQQRQLRGELDDFLSGLDDGVPIVLEAEHQSDRQHIDPELDRPDESGSSDTPTHFPAAKKPRWEAETCTLWYDEKLIRKVQSHNVAQNVHEILNAFEEQGWPEEGITSPFALDSQKYSAVYTLNRNLKGIRFSSCNQQGKRIIWSPK